MQLFAATFLTLILSQTTMAQDLFKSVEDRSTATKSGKEETSANEPKDRSTSTKSRMVQDLFSSVEDRSTATKSGKEETSANEPKDRSTSTKSRVRKSTAAPTTPYSATSISPDVSKGDAEIKGYYSLSWNEGNAGAKDSNASVFFNGWNSVKKGMREYEPESQPALKGFKYFSFGGGDRKSGSLSVAKLNAYVQDISLITAKGFQGVMFDIEVVKDSARDIIPAFQAAFKATKDAGLKVGITTSHSAPVITKTKQDAVDLINAWVRDTNVDLISPQLYENGNETAPQFEPTADCAEEGCTYDVYKNMHPGMQFAPSITYAKQYSKVRTHFKSKYGIETAGYFVYFENDDLGCNPMLWDCETSKLLIV